MSALGEAPKGIVMPPASASGIAFGFAFITVLFAVWTFLTASHDQSFGPLSMETGENLALGLWVGAPVVGGFFGRRATNRGAANAAALLGILVGGGIALFPTAGFGGYVCSIEMPPGAVSYMLGRLVVGALVGGGMGVALFLTAVGTRRGMTAIPAILAAGATYLGSLAAYTLFYEGVRCL